MLKLSWWVRSHGRAKTLAECVDNPNAPNNRGETPIHIAARYGHIQIVKLLMGYADNSNARDHYRSTTIHEGGQTEIVELDNINEI